MIKGCRTRGEGETKEERELQRPRQVVLLSFQNLVFPTSYFRLEGQGKVKEDLEIPPDRGETNRKESESQKELDKSIKSQLPLLLPVLQIGSNARSRSVGVQGTHSTSPVPTKSVAEHEANGEKVGKPTKRKRRRNSRHKSHSLQVWSQVWWLGGKAPLVTPPPLHRRSRRS